MPNSLAAYSLIASVALLLAPAGRAGTLVQSFDTWPSQAVWGTSTNEGWVLNSGQVRDFRAQGTLGVPFSDPQCGWLADADVYPGAFLQTPALDAGVQSVQYACRTAGTNDTSQVFQIQITTNSGASWIPCDSVTVAASAWRVFTNTINRADAQALRFAKISDTPALTNIALGLDDIQVIQPSGVLLYDLKITPALPTLQQPVHVQAKAGLPAGVTNFALETCYRFDPEGPFAAIAMTNIGASLYQTLAPIPAGAGYDGTVEYYVAATFSGAGTSPMYLPEGGSNAPAMYLPSNPYTGRSPRQLGPSSRRTPLIISEIMYHPAGATNELEYVELFNTEPVDQKIEGWRLAGSIRYVFPSNAVLKARGFVVVALDPDAMRATLPDVDIFGPFGGRLPNSGAGQVQLFNRWNALMLEVEYQTKAPWPIQADGAGHSLVLLRPDYGEEDDRAWGASRYAGGSPGQQEEEEDGADPLRQVLINEYLADPATPGTKDFIELYNHGSVPVDLAGCRLGVTPDSATYTFPSNTTILPDGYCVVTETGLGFGLNRKGDAIFLWSPAQGYVVDAVRFLARPAGIAGGRYPDGAPRCGDLEASTPGSANSPWRMDDIVINEIMFAPISGSDREEYVELFNKGTQSVNVSYWQIDGGIGFLIPPGTVLDPGGFLVIAKDAPWLISRYPQLNAANTLGSCRGTLSNRGEKLMLTRPLNPAEPFINPVLVDEVQYDDGWGEWADGGGSSLELKDPRSNNQLAANWAGSDESGKAPWTSFEFTGPMDNGAGTAASFQIAHLQPGEFLIDDVEVIRTGAGTNNCLVAPDFNPAGGWSMGGNHVQSFVSATQGVNSSRCLHVKATGRGGMASEDSYLYADVNRISAALEPVPAPPQALTLRAKGRWIAGWPFFRMGVQGLWFEGGAALAIPVTLGSPGLANSRLTNAPPAISGLAHAPVLPAAGQSVTITCRVEDPDGIAGVQLEYRPDGTATFTVTPMRDDGGGQDQAAGDGIFTADIPGAAGGSLIAFRVVVRDNHNPQAVAYAPSESTARLALIRFGEAKPAGTLGFYTVWMGMQNVTLLSSRAAYGNEPVDMTFVYNGERAIYNGGICYRGNTRRFAGYQQAGYTMSLPRGERFLGDDEMPVDIPSRNGSNGTLQQERHAFWVGATAGIPASYARFVRCCINGGPLLVRHDLQLPTRDISKSWFLDDDPHVYEAVDRDRDQLGSYFTSDTSPVRKDSVYRYTFPRKKIDSPDDDYRAVYRTLDALYLTDTNLYTARVAALVNIPGWAGYFAVNAATANSDSYGQNHYHNMFASFSPGYPSCLFLHDMDVVFNYLTVPIFPGMVVPTKMFANPPFRRTYLRVLADLAAGPLQPQTHNPELDGWFSAFKTNGISAVDPAVIKSFHAARLATINTTLASNAAAFAITAPAPGGSSSSNRVEIRGTAPVTAERITLNGRACRVRFDGVTTWQLSTGLQPGENMLHFEAFDRQDQRVAETTITLTGTAPAPDLRGKVIFSELMYHPPRGLGEYIELYNRGTQSVDLAGWRIDGVDFTFDHGAIIEPGQYAVVAQNLAWYAYLYTNSEAVAGVYGGTLANEGERLRLLQPLGTQAWTVISEVAYEDKAPWPVWADGYGQALQLVDTRQDPRIPGNWATADLNAGNPWRFVTRTGTTVDNVRNLTNVELQIYLSQAADVIVDHICLVTGVMAETGQNLLANGDFESPFALPWRLAGNHTNSVRVATNYPGSGVQALKIISDGYGKAGQHAVIVKPQSLIKSTTYTLSYWYLPRPGDALLAVEMTNSTLNFAHAIAPAPPDTAAFTPGESNALSRTLPELPALVINEWVLDNRSHTNAYNESSPWLEIYNAGSTTARLDACYISNDESNLRKWQFPTNAVLAPHSWQTLQLDARASLGDEWHTGFAPNPTNGTLLLSLGYNHENLSLDHLHYGAIGADTAIGCYPDGELNNRRILHVATPGSANILTSRVDQVWINEWMSDNTAIADPQDAAFSDWFELYNPGDRAVELSGWSLSDAANSIEPFRIPDGTYIAPKGFLLVWADKDPEQNNAGNGLHTDFNLGKEGDTLYCRAPDDTVVDQVTFSAQPENISNGRWPDGTADIRALGVATPGAKNQLEVFTNAPVNLTVVSGHGSPSPATGPHLVDYGTRVDCALEGSPEAAGIGTRYVCTGWATASNSGAQLTVALDLLADTTLTWQWATQHLLSATAAANGQISGPTGWITRAANVELTAAPAPYYAFSHWSGNVPAGQTNANPLAFTMDQPYTLAAHFTPMTTPHGTPLEWLAHFYPELGTNELAAVDGEDTDVDGLPTWAEFIAGTDPRDPSSVFKIRQAQLQGNDRLHIQWPVVTGRIYAVLGYSNLLDPAPALAFTNLPPDSDQTNELDLFQPLFYRLNVRQGP